ncbi:MAG: alanine--glyoxylate aminotransferase family protein [Lachnospiraceae bacterium]|nr:alanine--glyoxylate aminotransferase family protein [Lachnospiraceae bacterium]
MTPGPTQVASNVYRARSYTTTNPDLDPRFYDFYKETCEICASLLETTNPVYILGGEGILGLEAACASLTEPGDRVLVIDNGIFGKGFADFVRLYQGEPVLFTTDYHNPVSVEALRDYLERDHDFKYATLVHSDTPSGILNPVEELCPLLKSYGILTVVDSVTGMFADELHVDQAQIDIVCGGSQKALSAPPGLTMVAVSGDAFAAMHSRKTPIRSFYANLLPFEHYYENQWFPYTMPISDIYGLRAALENVKAEPEQIQRHVSLAKAVRETLQEAGLTLYLESGFASSVTVFYVPEGMTDRQILEDMIQRYHIMIAGCFDILAGKVLRIGHMGNNANVPDLADTMEALQGALEKLGFAVACDMRARFLSRC